MKFELVRLYGGALFMVLWAVVAWGDWQHQKVKHRHLLYGVWLAGAAYAFLIGNTLLGVLGHARDFHYWGFYRAVLAHLFLCCFAAMALWVLRVWPAGDAKLFAFLALLYPLVNVTGSFPQERVFLVVLINTFIPAALFLFVTAAIYVFNTRLRNSRAFLSELGWRRELDFIRQVVADLLRAWAASLSERWGKTRALGWESAARTAGSWLAALFPQFIQWLLGMAFMALLSYYLKDFFRSPVLLSMLCVAMFVIWGQVRQVLGPLLSRVVLGAGVAALFIWNPPTHWERFAQAFGSLSVFSFFMFLGMSGAMRMVSGGWGWIGTLVIPFVISAVMYLVMQVWNWIWWTARYVWQHMPVWAARHRPAVGPGELAGPAAGAIRGVLAQLHVAVSGMNLYLETLVELAVMGMFFGLSLVLVKMWDDEVRPTHRTEALASHLLLAPAFLDRIREDKEFFDEHFQSVYADGLTFDQAEALKEWCVEHGIEKVPLAPTMSFATWIFFGYFLSMLLGGRHALEVLL